MYGTPSDPSEAAAGKGERVGRSGDERAVPDA